MELKQHQKSLVAEYVVRLRRSEAPAQLITDFEELIAIDNGLVSLDRNWVEATGELFFHSCLSHNFSRPFDRDGMTAHFRPSINNAVAGGDFAWGTPLAGRLAEEQAYRRGYAQGFDEAHRMAVEGKQHLLLRRAETNSGLALCQSLV